MLSFHVKYELLYIRDGSRQINNIRKKEKGKDDSFLGFFSFFS